MSGCPFGGAASRRGFLTGAAGLAGALGAAGAADARPPSTHAPLNPTAAPASATLPFHGSHQQGIATPQQRHVHFAAFDLTASTRADVARLMQAWTLAAARLTQGQPVDDAYDPAQPPGDSGEVDGLPPARLTLTFGFGPGLFSQDGKDRYGLAARRPQALVDLPRFVGDQLVPQRTGGDLCIQACSDEPQSAFHAVRQLTRIALPYATTRWVQNGFLAGYQPGETPRNLMGFKDGTLNVATRDPKALDQYVWVGDEGGWMAGGTYMVTRPIRMALEHWDNMKLSFQEQTIGRQKRSGATLGATDEFAPLALDAVDKDGNPLTPENAHVRLAAPQSNDGTQILRRSYSYDNGVSFVAERWPPWRQGMEMDAGLLFSCFQRDPRTGFIRLFDKMSKFDMLNQFVTHVGGGLFAIPPGVAQGEYLGARLLEA
jgi:deferrochelatase/peroxidase EfeB